MSFPKVCWTSELQFCLLLCSSGEGCWCANQHKTSTCKKIVSGSHSTSGKKPGCVNLATDEVRQWDTIFLVSCQVPESGCEMVVFHYQQVNEKLWRGMRDKS